VEERLRKRREDFDVEKKEWVRQRGRRTSPGGGDSFIPEDHDVISHHEYAKKRNEGDHDDPLIQNSNSN
jgi:hypothetical protein